MPFWFFLCLSMSTDNPPFFSLEPFRSQTSKIYRKLALLASSFCFHFEDTALILSKQNNNIPRFASWKGLEGKGPEIAVSSKCPSTVSVGAKCAGLACFLRTGSAKYWTARFLLRTHRYAGQRWSPGSQPRSLQLAGWGVVFIVMLWQSKGRKS